MTYLRLHISMGPEVLEICSSKVSRLKPRVSDLFRARKLAGEVDGELM